MYLLCCFTYIIRTLSCFSCTYFALLHTSFGITLAFHVLTLLFYIHHTASLLLFMFLLCAFIYIIRTLSCFSCTYFALLHSSSGITLAFHVLTLLFYIHHSASLLLFMYLLCAFTYIIRHHSCFSCTYFALLYTSSGITLAFHVLTLLFYIHHPASLLLFMCFLCAFTYIILPLPCFSCTYFALLHTSSGITLAFHVLTLRFYIHHPAPLLLFMYLLCSFIYIIRHHSCFSCTYFALLYTSSGITLAFHVLTLLFYIHHPASLLLFMCLLCAFTYIILPLSCFSCTYFALLHTSSCPSLAFHVLTLRFYIHHPLSPFLFMYLLCLFTYIIRPLSCFSCTYFALLHTSFGLSRAFHVLTLPFYIHHPTSLLLFMYLLCSFTYIIRTLPRFSCTYFAFLHTSSDLSLAFHVLTLLFYIHHSDSPALFMYLLCLFTYIIRPLSCFSCTYFALLHTSFGLSRAFHVLTLPFYIHHPTSLLLFMYLLCSFTYIIRTLPRFSCTYFAFLHTSSDLSLAFHVLTLLFYIHHSDSPALFMYLLCLFTYIIRPLSCFSCTYFALLHTSSGLSCAFHVLTLTFYIHHSLSPLPFMYLFCTKILLKIKKVPPFKKRALTNLFCSV